MIQSYVPSLHGVICIVELFYCMFVHSIVQPTLSVGNYLITFSITQHLYHGNLQSRANKCHRLLLSIITRMKGKYFFLALTAWRIDPASTVGRTASLFGSSTRQRCHYLGLGDRVRTFAR